MPNATRCVGKVQQVSKSPQERSLCDDMRKRIQFQENTFAAWMRLFPCANDRSAQLNND